MKRKILLFSLAIFFGVLSQTAYPYWIWTPKTGKWINPKTAVKTTPKEQLELAKNLYDIKRFEEAKQEFKKLLKSYPKSNEAAEAQYFIGLIEETQGSLYAAFKAYQKVIDKYPFSERIQEIIEREYKIAQEFMAGKKRKGLGITLPVENPAIEIFTKIIENSNYGPFAAGAQYKLGLVLKGLARYYEAEEAFNKVISNYPGSEWAGAAKFQIASCRQIVSGGSAYDQAAAGEAKEKFEEFLREHPDAVLSDQAQKNIEQLKEKEAEGNFTIAGFYEKQKDHKAAKVYYEEIINNYPESKWAAKALEKLQIMEKKK